MQLVAFDALRVWDIPGVRQVKPENWLKSIDVIQAADWLLFPEYWQVGVLAFGLRKQIFPSLSSYYLGYSKTEMTYAFQAVCPENVPITQILPHTESAIEQILDEFTFPVVGKGVRGARGYQVWLIENRQELLDYAAQHPLLYIQEYLPIDRDLRVVVVGQDIVTAYWRIAPPGGFHNNVSQGGEVSFEDIPQNALDLVAQVATQLDINHAGFDVAIADGHPYLLEFNMRPGNEALRTQNIRLGQRILAYLQQQNGNPLPMATVPLSTALSTMPGGDPKSLFDPAQEPPLPAPV